MDKSTIKSTEFKEFRKSTKMNQAQFSNYYNIPYSTIQNWENGYRKCPTYLLELMKYKFINDSV